MKEIKIGKFSLAPWQILAIGGVSVIGIYTYMTRQTEGVPVADPDEVNPNAMGSTAGSDNTQDLRDVYNTMTENNKEIAKAFSNMSKQFGDYQSNTNSIIRQTNATLSAFQRQLKRAPQPEFNLNSYLIKGIKNKYGIDISEELNSGGSIEYKKHSKTTHVKNSSGGVTKIMTSTQEAYNKLSASDKAKVDKFVKDNNVDADIAIKYGLN